MLVKIFSFLVQIFIPLPYFQSIYIFPFFYSPTFYSFLIVDSFSPFIESYLTSNLSFFPESIYS